LRQLNVSIVSGRLETSTSWRMLTVLTVYASVVLSSPSGFWGAARIVETPG
jgi:hypothetical protein